MFWLYDFCIGGIPCYRNITRHTRNIKPFIHNLQGFLFAFFRIRDNLSRVETACSGRKNANDGLRQRQGHVPYHPVPPRRPRRSRSNNGRCRSAMTACRRSRTRNWRRNAGRNSTSRRGTRKTGSTASLCRENSKKEERCG